MLRSTSGPCSPVDKKVADIPIIMSPAYANLLLSCLTAQATATANAPATATANATANAPANATANATAPANAPATAPAAANAPAAATANAPAAATANAPAPAAANAPAAATANATATATKFSTGKTCLTTRFAGAAPIIKMTGGTTTMAIRPITAARCQPQFSWGNNSVSPNAMAWPLNPHYNPARNTG